MIEWIVTSSALILLVLLLRLLVRDRVSPRLRYALWGLVLLRLVIPVSLWESPASVLRAAQVNEGYQLVSTLPNYMSLYENGNWRSVAGPDGTFQMEPDAAGRWEVNQPRLHNAYGWVAVPSAEEARALRDQGQKAVDTAGLKRLVDVQNVLRMVWQAGIWLFMLFLAAVNGKFALDLRRGRRPDGEYRGRPVFIMDNLPTPCLFGLFRPGIYLTPGLEEDEKPHVLAHEYAHFRQGDHIWAVLRGVCLALHWYNPLVWLAAYLSRRDCELSCDEGAVRLLGEENRADYGRTLVGLVARRTTPGDLACCATTMTGGKSALKERIALLVKRPRTTAVMAVLIAAACIAFAACTFTGAAEAEEPAEPVEPVQAEEEPQEADPPDDLPSLEDLPTEVLDAHTLGDLYENTDPCWLLDQVEGEDIALYGVNPMGAADEVRGIYLRYGERLQYFDQVAMPYQFICPRLTWYDFDGDGENELLAVYSVDRGTTMDINELVVYEWEDDRWSEHRYDPAGLIADFNANAEFESDGDVSRISYRDRSTQVALGGEECFLSGSVVSYNLYGKDGWGILLTLWGEVGPALTSHNYAFDYMCDIYYNPDGTFTEGSGIFESFYEPEPDLPALEDLPTRLVSPGTPEEEGDIWLLAELPEDGVAVYYEPGTNQSWLRYGEALQALDTGGRPAITPRMLLPELYFQDLDGDGEKELAMICHSDSGAGVSVWDLLICEWDGRQWTAYPIDAARAVIDDFNASRTLAVFRDTGSAEAGYLDSAVTVDLNAIYRERGRTLPPDASLSCALDADNYGYMMHRSGQIFLHINGAVRAEDDPAHENNLLYTCAIEYQGDGVFKVRDEGLSAWYPYFALTPAFREILLDFIQERQEAGGGEDISADRFAVRDVNGDGRDELITQTNAAPMAGQVETVYDGDGNTLLSAYPFMTYYDNGCAKAGWSHNQGVAGNTLWPYTLFKYDEDAGKYVHIADVDGWDRSIRDTYLSYDESVIPFPEEVDKDGDGFVYYIIEEEGGYAPVYGEPMDYGDYALWADRYLGGNVVRPSYFSLSKENIALIQQ